MAINKISIIGLGALGIMYADFFTGRMPQGCVSIIADEDRIRKYKETGIFSNEKKCSFYYEKPDENSIPADLLIVAVKNYGLEQAMKTMAPFVGSNTIIISTLNGVTSEEILAERFGKEKVLLCTAQGMDAVKQGNRLTYKHLGYLSIGTEDGSSGRQLEETAEFFDKMQFPYKIVPDMKRQLWNKLMLNVGVNQVTAVYQTTYGGVQKYGEPRRMMIEAMNETARVAAAYGINLSEQDVDDWLKLVDGLNSEGMPSMRQDVLAQRKTEVEQFAGTIIRYGKKKNIDTPVNRILYERITAIENNYGREA